jgi:hypothetical protein
MSRLRIAQTMNGSNLLLTNNEPVIKTVETLLIALAFI